MRVQWDEKYAQWMQETEKKIQELKDANTLLQSYLHKHESSVEKTFSRTNGETSRGDSAD